MVNGRVWSLWLSLSWNLRTRPLGQTLDNYANAFTSLGLDIGYTSIRVRAKDIQDLQSKKYQQDIHKVCYLCFRELAKKVMLTGGFIVVPDEKKTLGIDAPTPPA